MRGDRTARAVGTPRRTRHRGGPGGVGSTTPWSAGGAYVAVGRPVPPTASGRARPPIVAVWRRGLVRLRRGPLRPRRRADADGRGAHAGLGGDVRRLPRGRDAPAPTPRRTPTPTTSPTSTASRATTACATSWPRAASGCPRATRPTRRTAETVCGLGNRKNDAFNVVLDARRRRAVPRLGAPCSTTCASWACRSPSSRRRPTRPRCSTRPASPTGSSPSSTAGRHRPRAGRQAGARHVRRTPPTVCGVDPGALGRRRGRRVRRARGRRGRLRPRHRRRPRRRRRRAARARRRRRGRRPRRRRWTSGELA